MNRNQKARIDVALKRISAHVSVEVEPEVFWEALADKLDALSARPESQPKPYPHGTCWDCGRPTFGCPGHY